MFRLNNYEFSELVTNCDRFKSLKHSSSSPYAFTELGASLKDLGRKWFAFSLMKEWTGREILERMEI